MFYDFVAYAFVAFRYAFVSFMISQRSSCEMKPPPLNPHPALPLPHLPSILSSPASDSPGWSSSSSSSSRRTPCHTQHQQQTRATDEVTRYDAPAARQLPFVLSVCLPLARPTLAALGRYIHTYIICIFLFRLFVFFCRVCLYRFFVVVTHFRYSLRFVRTKKLHLNTHTNTHTHSIMVYYDTVEARVGLIGSIVTVALWNKLFRYASIWLPNNPQLLAICFVSPNIRNNILCVRMYQWNRSSNLRSASFRPNPNFKIYPENVTLIWQWSHCVRVSGHSISEHWHRTVQPTWQLPPGSFNKSLPGDNT